MMKQRILFVCLGNICRSSSAEEIMRTLVRRAGREKEFEIDSAGISGFHEGELPDERMRAHKSALRCSCHSCPLQSFLPCQDCSDA